MTSEASTFERAALEVLKFHARRVMSEVDEAAAVLQALGVSAGHGLIIDWREVRSGETVCEGDAFDVAQAFVRLVGEDAALAAETADTTREETMR